MLLRARHTGCRICKTFLKGYWDKVIDMSLCLTTCSAPDNSGQFPGACRHLFPSIPKAKFCSIMWPWRVVVYDGVFWMILLTLVSYVSFWVGVLLQAVSASSNILIQGVSPKPPSLPAAMKNSKTFAALSSPSSAEVTTAASKLP